MEIDYLHMHILRDLIPTDAERVEGLNNLFNSLPEIHLPYDRMTLMKAVLAEYKVPSFFFSDYQSTYQLFDTFVHLSAYHYEREILKCRLGVTKLINQNVTYKGRFKAVIRKLENDGLIYIKVLDKEYKKQPKFFKVIASDLSGDNP